jgi:hypothetical protein
MAMAATLSATSVRAEDATYLPCLTRFGATEALQTNFSTAGWSELTTPEDRALAAKAVGELQYLLIRMPRRAEGAAELEEMLQRMHQQMARYADDGDLLFFQRGPDFAMVAAAGVMSGTGTDVRCMIVGPELEGVRDAIEADGNGGTIGDRLMAFDHARILADGEPHLTDLQIDALEFLFDGTPVEPVYGPLNLIVTYMADRP